MRGRLLRIFIWILVGLSLRVVALDGDGLWCDEGYTAWIAHLSSDEYATARANDDAPPLYYTIQRSLLPNLPPNETSVRLLSAAAGVAGIVWLAALPPVAGLIEAPVAFLAAGTYGALHARQARSYTVLMLFGLMLMTATAKVIEGRRRWLLLVVLSEALALWTHNVGAALVVGANAAWLLCSRRDRLRWFAGQLVVFILWLPCLVHSLPQLAVHGKLNQWIGQYWESVPIALAPLMSLGTFTSGALVLPSPPADRWYYEGPGALIPAFLAFAAVAVLLISAFRKGQRQEALFAASFTLGPLVALMILSIVTSPTYILGRTDAVAYVGFVVWLALGLRTLPKVGRFIVIVILVASTTLAIATRFPVAGQARENDRRVGEVLSDRAEEGDWVFYSGLSRPSVDYYLSGGRPGRSNDRIERFQFPMSFGDNPAGVFPAPAESLGTWEDEAWRLRRRAEAITLYQGEPFHIYLVGPILAAPNIDPTASDLPYPSNILAYVLNGLRDLDPLVRLPGDGMRGDWILFRVRSDSLMPESDLQPIEVAR